MPECALLYKKHDISIMMCVIMHPEYSSDRPQRGGRPVARPAVPASRKHPVVIGGGCAARERRWKGPKPDAVALSASLSRRRGRLEYSGCNTSHTETDRPATSSRPGKGLLHCTQELSTY